jgi:hypothetical protein
MVTIEIGPTPIEQLSDNVHRFYEHLSPVWARGDQPAGLEQFVLSPASTEPGFEPAATQALHTQGGLSEFDGVPEEVGAIACSELDGGGSSSQSTQGGPHMGRGAGHIE